MASAATAAPASGRHAPPEFVASFKDEKDAFVKRRAGHVKTEETCHSVAAVASFKYQLKDGCAIVASYNFKGGVGKTTVTTNLAATFALRGKRALMVDFDPQTSKSPIVINHDAV